MITRELLRFLAAISFFTRIPLISKIPVTGEHYKKTLRYLTWIGFIISIPGAVLLYYGPHLIPLPVTILISMSVTTILTGAIHEDGLADVCDAFGGGYSRQRILDIMKDSHIGTFGVIALVLSYLIRFTALLSFPTDMLPFIFIAGNTISRFSLSGIVPFYNYARTNDKSSKSISVINRFGIYDFIISGIPLVPILMFAKGISFVFLLIPVFLCAYLFANYFKRKIDGYTGDCLGAIQQITELIFYIAALIWIKYTL